MKKRSLFTLGVMLSLLLLSSCTTVRMWRQNDNVLSNTIMTPVKLVEDVLTLGGVAHPVEGSMFWMDVFNVIDGGAIPIQIRNMPAQALPAYPHSSTYPRYPSYPRYRQSGGYSHDFNDMLHTYPTASGPERLDPYYEPPAYQP